MAVPKKRTGHSAQGKRRSNWKATKPVLTTCPNCGQKMLAHTVCTACGQYKGKVVSRKAEGFAEGGAKAEAKAEVNTEVKEEVKTTKKAPAKKTAAKKTAAKKTAAKPAKNTPKSNKAVKNSFFIKPTLFTKKITISV